MLLRADLPDGRVLEYLHDPSGRRIAAKVNGQITEKYRWQGLTRLLAIYDASDNLLVRFQYADGRMPISKTSGGSTYYLTYDQIGSLRAVTDATGNVIKRIDYDAFGNIITDTNPAFHLMLGFAGGLTDPDTGLIRFGYRDYNPDTGRWTAKDPILFQGGDTDLYGYVLNDPVNFVDPEGKFPWVPIGIGIGLAFTGYKVYNMIKNSLDYEKQREISQKEINKIQTACEAGDIEAWENADQEYRDAVVKGTKSLGKAGIDAKDLEFSIMGRSGKIAK